MRRRITLGAFSLLLVALGFATFAFLSAHWARNSLTLIAQKRALFAVAVERAQARAAVRERTAAEALSPVPTGTPAGATAPAPDAAGRAARPAAPPSLAALLAADPKLMDLYLHSYRANLYLRYGAYYEKLNLTPAQIGRFEKLTTAHEAEGMDLRAAAEAQGLDPDDPGIAALRQKSNQEQRLALTQLALSAGISAAALKQYSAGLPSSHTQEIVSGMASFVALTPTPIANAQAAQLGPAIEAATTPAPKDSKAEAAVDWDKVTLQATGFLSAPQVEAVRAQATLQQLSGMVKQFYGRPPVAGAGP